MWMDPGHLEKNWDPESDMEKSRIRDKHPGSATLIEGKGTPCCCCT
jgi:hypothetical protein